MGSRLIEIDPSSPWKAWDVEEIAKAMGLWQTLCALAFARGLHHGLRRKDGRINFVHSYRLAQILMYLGVYDDEVLAAAILHDVVEDVEIISIREIGANFNPRVTALVCRVSDNMWPSKRVYYNAISFDPKAEEIKLVDRFHNLKNFVKNFGLNGFFSKKRLEKKINETIAFIVKRFGESDRHSEQSRILMFKILELIAEAERLIS